MFTVYNTQIIPHLNISNWLTRSHPSKGEIAVEIDRKNYRYEQVLRRVTTDLYQQALCVVGYKNKTNHKS